MVEHDGKFFSAVRKGFDGKETNVVEEQIDYVIGSGNHARSYLHRGPDGHLLNAGLLVCREIGLLGDEPGTIARARRIFARNPRRVHALPQRPAA